MPAKRFFNAMPEMTFRIRWPDDTRAACYSPSSTVKDFFTVGEAYPLAEFLDRSRRAMHHASERVRQRYGYACSSAMSELKHIETLASRFASQPDARVVVEGFDG